MRLRLTARVRCCSAADWKLQQVTDARRLLDRLLTR
jgi:hypothetical protein